MGTKQRRCKCCGALFTPKGAGDHFCSGLCRTSGLFVSGGGDTSKPLSPERKKMLEKSGGAQKDIPKKPAKRYRADAAEKYPRVVAMLALLREDRWRVAKNFSEEEREYARSLAQKELSEERRFMEIASWDGTGDEAEEYGEVVEDIGDSDDGTI